MPMFKIYVGNLDPRVTIEQVRELFSPFATIEDAVLVADSASGKPKGFAIVMIRDAEIGRAAVKATQGKRLLGKTLTINEVMKKGKAAAKAAKEVRQGPFGPHFNRQGGGRAGGMRAGGPRRGMNRGPRGPSSGFGGQVQRPPLGGSSGSARPFGGGPSVGPRPAGDGHGPASRDFGGPRPDAAGDADVGRRPVRPDSEGRSAADDGAQPS